jgi:hypothetical protein
MAHFRGTLQGCRGGASRLGSEKSGLQVSCNGWNIGVNCMAVYDEASGKDKIHIMATGGSNGGPSEVFVATVSREDGVIKVER